MWHVRNDLNAEMAETRLNDDYLGNKQSCATINNVVFTFDWYLEMPKRCISGKSYYKNKFTSRKNNI